MIKVLMVCHGNICRSTMAEYVMRHLAAEAGLAEQFVIDSAATSAEEIGNPVHCGTRRKLAEVGIPCGSHRAHRMTRADYEAFDLLIGMDEANRRDVLRILGGDPAGKVSLLLDWCGGGAIADPWYTGKFDDTYRDVVRGCTALLEKLA